jgi:pheromone shutdown protein TraB
MHKLLERAPVIYAAFLLLFTIPFLVSLYFGDQLIMSHGVVWFILNILIEATLTAFCAAKRKISTTAENIVSQFLPLLSLLYIGMTGAVIREVNAFLLILHAMICFVCCFVVSFLYKNGPVFRVAWRHLSLR